MSKLRVCYVELAAAFHGPPTRPLFGLELHIGFGSSCLHRPISNTPDWHPYLSVLRGRTLEGENESMGGSLKTKPRKQREKPARNGASALLLVEYSKVRVRNAQGKYLIANHSDWSFSFDRSRALIFDYLGDETREQLSSIARAQDLPLELVPVEPKDFLERCDRCQQLSAPSDICFNGFQFLCRRCNNWPE